MSHAWMPQDTEQQKSVKSLDRAAKNGKYRKFWANLKLEWKELMKK